MFAMFHLGRMDVLPVGDLGIRNGMKMLYGLPVSTTAALPVPQLCTIGQSPGIPCISAHFPYDLNA